MTTQAAQVIAIQGYAPDTAGAIVYWRLSGPIVLADAMAAWRNAGLPESLGPRQIPEHRAMTRAAKELEANRRFLRKLPQGNGWAVVDEEAVGGELSHRTIGSVQIAGKRLEVAPYDAPWAQQVRDAYQEHLGLLDTVDVSGWLTDWLAPTLQAVALRDTGGVYFVPRQHVERYRAYTAAIKAVSKHTFFEIPALRSDEAVVAVLDAVRREADGAVAQIEADLADAANMSARSLKVRAARCEKVLALVQSYGELLGVELEALARKIEGLQAGIVSASLVAKAAEEKAA